MKGQSLLSASGALDATKLQTITSRFEATGMAIQQTVTETTGSSHVAELVTASATEVEQALNTDKWRILFPGRDLLAAFAKREGLGNSVVLQNSVIKALGSGVFRVDEELSGIIETIQNDGEL
jgi:hypothetical protein